MNQSFPKHTNKIKNRDISTYDAADDILRLCKRNNDSYYNKSIRELLSGFYNKLEREEGYQYGLSEGFIENLELANGKGYNPNGKIFTLEHAVPLKCLIDYIRKTNFDTIESFISFLKKEYTLYLITKEEDALLRNSPVGNLSQKMPEGSTIFDRKARYEAAGIKINRDPIFS